MVNFGYIKKQRHGYYANTRLTDKWLTNKSSTNFIYYVLFWNIAYKFWNIYINECIVNGKPSVSFYQWIGKDDYQNRDNWKIVQLGFQTLAKFTVGHIISLIKLSTKSKIKLLDIGGGHGEYSIKFCEKYSNLEATIFDLPPALAVAKEIITKTNMSKKIYFQAGDYKSDELNKICTSNGTQKMNYSLYDVVLVFNILHANTKEENEQLLQKVNTSLNPNGMVVILEQIQSNKNYAKSSFSNSFIGFLNMSYLVLLGGKIYTYNEIEKWLIKAGFVNICKKSPLNLPGINIITAKKTDWQK